MVRYLKLWWAFFLASLKAELEFRANLLMWLIVDVTWYGAQIMLFEMLFRFTPRIGGWDLPQTRIFLGIMFFIDSVTMVLFSHNIDALSEKVRRGDLDLALAKPVNAQFLISMGRVGVGSFLHMSLALAWLTWSLRALGEVSVGQVLWLVALVPCGILIFYSFRFMLSTASVIFTRAENLQYLWYTIYRFGTRPDALYSRWLRFVILTIFPVGLIASVPASAILGEPRPWLFAWAIFVAVFALWLSTKFWKFSLEKYSSASS